MSNVLTKKNTPQKIAEFLFDFLTEEFKKEITASNGSIPNNVIVVKGIRNYDAFDVSLADMPILKVYKTRDNFIKGNAFRISEGAITYALSYPDLKLLPNLLDWVAYKINLGLLTYSRTDQHLLPPPNNQAYVAEYLLSVNEQTNVIYPFLRFNIQFKNFLDTTLYQ